MRKELRHLRQLENELLALGEEAMLLEELDGLVAGVLVCPEMIPPSEWLSVVWGQTGRFYQRVAYGRLRVISPDWSRKDECARRL
jgi:yecA family protein